MTRVSVLFAALLSALVLASTAIAGGSAERGYGGQGGGVQAQLDQPIQQATPTGALPFTGLDLALLVGGGAGLVLVGAGLRRLGANRA